MTIHDLLRAQINDIWGKGDVDLVDRNYADTVVDHMPIPGQRSGRAAMKDVVRLFRKTMPDLKMKLHGTLAAGDMGVDFWTLTGTHSEEFMGIKPKGTSIRISGIDMVRIAEDRITELWHVEEMLQFWQQVGLSTAPFGQPMSTVVGVPPPTSTQHDPGDGAIVTLSDRPTPTELRNLGIARRHIEELWARSRAELGYELYAPDVMDQNPAPKQRPGVDGIIDVIYWMTQAVPNLQMSVKHYIVDGDLVT